jgi:hypothetical protein
MQDFVYTTTITELIEIKQSMLKVTESVYIYIQLWFISLYQATSRILDTKYKTDMLILWLRKTTYKTFDLLLLLLTKRIYNLIVGKKTIIEAGMRIDGINMCISLIVNLLYNIYHYSHFYNCNFIIIS